MKKPLIFICSIIIIVCVSIPIFASSPTYTWFCAHRRDHLQPKSDSSFNFISEYDAFFIDKNHGDDCDDKVIYLTFDAGYNNGNIDTILDVLKDENLDEIESIQSKLLDQAYEMLKSGGEITKRAP